MFKICKHQFGQALSSPRVYLALLLGCVVQIISSMPLLEFSKQIGKPLNIFDSFIYFNCDTYIIATAFLGILILASDIPFSTQSETYTLMRVSRRKWVLGKILYLFCACVIYYFIIMIAGMLFIAENAYVANAWSELIYYLAKNINPEMAADANVYFSYSHVLLLSPLQALAASFTLSVAYSFVMSLFIFYLNLKLPRILSFAAAIMIHVIGYLLAVLFTSRFYIKFSLLGNSLLMYHDIQNVYKGKVFTTLPQSFLIFSVLAAVLSALIMTAIRKYDFRITVGAKQ